MSHDAEQVCRQVSPLRTWSSCRPRMSGHTTLLNSELNSEAVHFYRHVVCTLSHLLRTSFRPQFLKKQSCSHLLEFLQIIWAHFPSAQSCSHAWATLAQLRWSHGSWEEHFWEQLGVATMQAAASVPTALLACVVLRRRPATHVTQRLQNGTRLFARALANSRGTLGHSFGRGK